jgi:hypothetical protein
MSYCEGHDMEPQKIQRGKSKALIKELTMSSMARECSNTYEYDADSVNN